MKRILPLCLACLASLSACSVQGAAIPAAAPAPALSAAPAPAVPSIQPQERLAPSASPLSISLETQALEGTEWNGGLSSLPQTLVDGQAELSDLWDEPSGTVLLAQLPEKDIFLYGIWDEETPEERCLLRVGDRAWSYDLPWATPRCLLPQLHCGDFDGDGEDELAMLAYTGSGTGVSVWTLCIVESDLSASLLSDLAYEDALAPYLGCAYSKGEQRAVITLGNSDFAADLSEYDLTDDSPLEAYAGTIVEYAMEEDAITAQLAVGLYGKGLPYTVCYFCQLEGQIVYDGAGFSLTDPVLLPYDL